MKKLILVLAIALMAVPAMAIDVALVREGTTNVIDVVYTGNGTDATTRVRAFALDITSPAGTTMTLVPGSFKTGESIAPAKGGTLGYGIFPARITIDSAGNVPEGGYGTPLADTLDPAPGADGSNHIVLEFGSLYFNADVNAPLASDTLCKFTFNPGTAAAPIMISMTDELTYRGGVVFENGGQALTAADKSIEYQIATLPGQATTPSPANAAVNVNRSTTTLSWAAGTGAVTRDVYFGTAATPTVKVIDNGAATTYNPGTLVGKKTYYWRVDERNSAGTTTGVVWSFTTACKGDFATPASGDVTTADISALVIYYNANKNAFGKAPLTGPGYVYGMDLTGDNFVTTADISALVIYYNANKNAFGKAPCMP
jgi:hypothetical protein